MEDPENRDLLDCLVPAVKTVKTSKSASSVQSCCTGSMTNSAESMLLLQMPPGLATCSLFLLRKYLTESSQTL